MKRRKTAWGPEHECSSSPIDARFPATSAGAVAPDWHHRLHLRAEAPKVAGHSHAPVARAAPKKQATMDVR